MSASPTAAVASTKRPLEDPSSPSGPTDQPDAKRPALDKVVKAEEESKFAVEDQKPGQNAGQTGAAGEGNDVKDGQGDLVVPDAPNNGSAAVVLETQPIQSTASHNDRASSQPASQGPAQDETGWIHIRAVISSAEAATCIGKGGENVSQIRRLSGAKCTVSDYSRGAVERILTVSGPQDAVAKVCISPLIPRGYFLSNLLLSCCRTGIRFDHQNPQQ
jgi:poly(rC)-binding protein 2/3/4